MYDVYMINIQLLYNSYTTQPMVSWPILGMYERDVCLQICKHNWCQPATQPLTHWFAYVFLWLS